MLPLVNLLCIVAAIVTGLGISKKIFDKIEKLDSKVNDIIVEMQEKEDCLNKINLKEEFADLKEMIKKNRQKKEKKKEIIVEEKNEPPVVEEAPKKERKTKIIFPNKRRRGGNSKKPPKSKVIGTIN